MTAARRAGLLAAALAGVLALALWLAGSGAEELTAPASLAPREAVPAPAAALPDVAPPSAQAEPLLAPARGLRAHLATDGVPVVPVHVELLGEGDRVLDRRTCTAGEVRWDDLPPGRYRVNAPNWEAVPSLVELAEGAACDVALVPRNAIAGRVLGLRSRAPRTSFKLRVLLTEADGNGRRAEYGPFPFESAEGRFHLAGLPLAGARGPQEVELRTQRATSGRLPAPPDLRLDDLLLLDAEVALSLRLLDVEGAPIDPLPDWGLFALVDASLPDGALRLRNARSLQIEPAIDARGDPGRRTPFRGFWSQPTSGPVTFSPDEPVDRPVRVLACLEGRAAVLSPAFTLAEDGPPVEMEIVLPAECTLEGSFETEGFENPDKVGLSDVWVRPVDGQDAPWIGAELSTRTGLEGNRTLVFRAQGLVPGRHEVLATIQDWAGQFGPRSSVTRLTRCEVSLAPGSNAMTLCFDETTAFTWIMGMIILPERETYLDIGITAFARDERGALVRVVDGPVGQDGWFMLAGLKPGEHTLLVKASLWEFLSAVGVCRTEASATGMPAELAQRLQVAATPPDLSLLVRLDISRPELTFTAAGEITTVHIERLSPVLTPEDAVLATVPLTIAQGPGGVLLSGLPPGEYLATAEAGEARFTIDAGIDHMEIELR